MKQKIALISALFAVVSIVAFALPSLVSAAVTLSISGAIPGATLSGGANPGSWINAFYSLALLLGGVLAFGAVVYGGVLYAASGGNPSRQSDAKEWIWSALIGLLLLAGAYLILYTINPGLTNVAFPALSNLSSVGSYIYTGGGTFNGGGGPAVNPGTGVTGATNGLLGITVGALNDLQAACTQQSGSSCSVNVTSGVGGTHAAGACDHADGCKADIAGNTSLNAYLNSLPSVSCTPSPCWAPLVQAPDGAIYANELTCPSSCSGGCSANGVGSCNWTGPHWDMAATSTGAGTGH